MQRNKHIFKFLNSLNHILVFVFLFFNNSPIVYSQEYGFKAYGHKDGLVSNQIWNIQQDSSGFLWLASVEGCSRFDGKESINFTKNDGLTTTQVWDFAFYHDTVFLLLNNHINIIVDMKVYNWPISEGLVYRNYNFIYYNGNPCIWATLPNDTDIIYDIRKNEHILGFDSLLNIDKQKFGLWYNVHNRLFLNHKDLKSNIENFYEIYKNENGNIDAAFSSKFTYKNQIDNANNILGNRIFHLHNIDSNEFINDNLFFNSEFAISLEIYPKVYLINHEQQVYIYKNGKITNINFNFGSVHAFFKSKDGSIWIAADGGLIKMFNDGILNYPSSIGYQKYNWSIFPISLNNIWLGGFDNGLHHYINNKEVEQIINKYNGYILSPYSGVVRGFKNDIVIPTGNKGLFVYDFDNKTFRVIKCPINSDTYFVWKDTIANRIITGRDVVFYLNYDYTLDSVFRINMRANLQRVNAVTRRDSFYYFSSGNNLLEYNINSNKQRWLGFKDIRFNSIAMDNWRNLWAASDIGIYFLEGRDTMSWMQDQHFWALKIDRKNRLFAVSKKGLYILDLNKFYKTMNPEFIYFGEEEGFYGAGDQDAFYLDDNNKMWLPGATNNVVIDADELNLNIPKINTIITKAIAINDSVNHELKIEKANELPHTYKDLYFSFLSVCYSSPSKVRYQYRLVGYDKKWSSPTELRFIRYTNIPSGNYRFEIRAALNEDFDESQISSVSFSITPPFWLTWWFISILIVVLSFSLFMILKFRIKKISRQFDQKQKLQHLEMEVLQMQIRPHFIGNSLELIKNFVLEDNKKKSVESINSFGKMLRDVTQYINQPYISLEEEIEIINNFILFHRIKFNESFDFRLIGFDLESKKSIEVPPLILQPFVENAIVHGFRNINYTGLLIIDISYFDNYFLIKIIDNGRGRDQIWSKKSNVHKSIGVTNSIERLKIFNESKEMPVRITDLEKGTEVEIKIYKI